MFTVVVTFSISDVLTNCVHEPDYMFWGLGVRGEGDGLVNYYYLGGGSKRRVLGPYMA